MILLSRKKQGQTLNPDFKTINWKQQQDTVIRRVFERGNQSKKDEIVRFYCRKTAEVT